jgi:hypothetical protein
LGCAGGNELSALFVKKLESYLVFKLMQVKAYGRLGKMQAV